MGKFKKYLLLTILLVSINCFSQDRNFYVFICFGQSNMEGAGKIEKQDILVSDRFLTFQAVDCPELERKKNFWYTATPPLCRCSLRLSIIDQFGKTMTANLPDSIRIGVINVSVSSGRIELFDKDIFHLYDSALTDKWYLDIIRTYNGNPYKYLVSLVKEAMENGIVKGILLHQGESNNGDILWPSKVKKIYYDLMEELKLSPDSVPLLAGQVAHVDQGGKFSKMNSIISLLPDSIPTAHIISSNGCELKSDSIHFSPKGMRRLGRRYALKMLSLMNYEVQYIKGLESLNFEPECEVVGDSYQILTSIDASNNCYVKPIPEVNSDSLKNIENKNLINIPFTLDSAGYYSIYMRQISSKATYDSCFIKIDNQLTMPVNEIQSTNWQWIYLNSMDLAEGSHLLSIICLSENIKIDKINISNHQFPPSDFGVDALNTCIPQFSIVNIENKYNNENILFQNYPNPFSINTNIRFKINITTNVILKVFDLNGLEIVEVCNKEFNSGMHTLKCTFTNIPNGHYLYTIKTNNFSETRKMIIKSK